MLLVLLLNGCGKAAADGAAVSAHFSALTGFTAQLKILSDLDESTLAYEVEYAYHKEDADAFTITAPESVAGIGGTIAGTDTAQFNLQYDGMALDDAMPRRPGMTAADGFFAVLADLRGGAPAQQWTETVQGKPLLVLRYEGEDDVGSIARQVWLTEDGKTPVYAELYADGKCVLTIQVAQYQPQ